MFHWTCSGKSTQIDFCRNLVGARGLAMPGPFGSCSDICATRTACQCRCQGKLIDAFGEFLRTERRLSASTLTNYLPIVRGFLDAQFGGKDPDFDHLRVGDVHRFIVGVPRPGRSDAPSWWSPRCVRFCASCSNAGCLRLISLSRCLGSPGGAWRLPMRRPRDRVGADISAPFTLEAERSEQNQRKMLPAHRSQSRRLTCGFFLRAYSAIATDS